MKIIKTESLSKPIGPREIIALCIVYFESSNCYTVFIKPMDTRNQRAEIVFINYHDYPTLAEAEIAFNWLKKGSY